MKPQLSGYRIERLKSRAKVFLVGGRALEGSFFVSPISSNYTGQQSLLELLCEEQRFLPFETRQGKVILLEKMNILRVLTEEERPSYPPGSRSSGQISIWFNDGLHLEGELFFSMPTTHCRLSDFLNQSAQFYYFHTHNHIYLINRDHVTFVEPGNGH